MLPKNNKHYLWQVCYMAIGLGVLFFRPEDFTFFQTFLFLAPVVLDIVNTNFTTESMNWVRRGFGFVDTILLISCFLGMLGALQDTGKSFVVRESFLYFSGVEIEKTTVGVIIAVNLAVPFMFYIGAPCQETVKLLSRLKAISQGGVKQE